MAEGREGARPAGDRGGLRGERPPEASRGARGAWGALRGPPNLKRLSSTSAPARPGREERGGPGGPSEAPQYDYRVLSTEAGPEPSMMRAMVSRRMVSENSYPATTYRPGAISIAFMKKPWLR